MDVFGIGGCVFFVIVCFDWLIFLLMIIFCNMCMCFNKEWKEYEEKIFIERDLWKYEGDMVRRINLL